MRWAEETYYGCYDGNKKHYLASCQDDVDHPGLEFLQEAWSPIVSVMLPDLHSVLLEVILDAPVSAFGLCFLIFKTLANGLLIA